MKRIPLAVPNLAGDEAQLLQDCITSTFVSSVGPFVDEFEDQIARVSGTASSAVLSSGTVALQMAFEGLGIGAADLVMMPSLTFIATSNSIKHAGADPWIVDVTEEGWALDVELCRALLEAETIPAEQGRKHVQTGKTVKAIVPVLIMGNSVDLEAYVQLATEYDLRVVVDAAAAIGGALTDGALLGSANVDAICYSFNGNKTVTCGGGGAVASNDEVMIARIKHLSSTGRVGAEYDHDVVAYNFRMTNVQAALGVAQLRRLDDFLAAKAKIADAYDQLANRFAELSTFPLSDGQPSAHWFSGVFYTGDDAGVCGAFRDHMQKAGVDLRKFWKPIHLQTPYKDALCSRVDVSDKIWERIFPLPCSTGLTESELATVITAAEDFWGSQ